MMRRLRRGFTLIEILVAMTIGVLLLLMVAPQMSLWMSDSEIRNGAQSVAEGMRTAQAAAVSHNLNAQFVLTATGWTVQMADPPNAVLQTATFLEGSKYAVFKAVDIANAAATTVTFNALGQVVPAATSIVKVDVTKPSVTGTRPLRVMVGDLTAGTTFNGVKLCDPGFPATDPKGCP
jgi:prepilin-type N-terminal cleavage/methylation domain-containing protein